MPNDDWRKYKAELHDPEAPEYPHLEVFSADNDAMAIEQAYELCNATSGMTVLEVHELNEEYDSIRELDLGNKGQPLRRYMDVDLIEFLGQIAEKTIIHYPNDFKIDTDTLWKAAISDNPADKKFMWHCCSFGTHLLDEQEVFTKDTGAFSSWVNYRPNDKDLFGYVVEVMGYRNDTVVGNVYDIGDYAKHAFHVNKTALPLDSVSLIYSDAWGINAGKTITASKREHDNDRNQLFSESGNVIGIKYHPDEKSQTMSALLQVENERRLNLQIGNTEEHLQKLDVKLAELRGLPEPKETVVTTVPSTSLINGDVQCFDIVIATGDSNYPYLVGEVNAVDKLGTPEHNSGNSTDDVFVDFQSENYPEQRKREIEAHFSQLHGTPKRYDEDLALNLFNERVAPHHLIKIKESDLPFLLESQDNCEIFCDNVLSSYNQKVVPSKPAQVKTTKTENPPPKVKPKKRNRGGDR